tara:strand:- start:986 stop:1231 length:246 start_codon:yes stop_codon:yes gene_type:complete
MEDFLICDMLHNLYEKPKNFLMCKAVNVYDNKYRINVYSKLYDPLSQLERKFISQSFFCRLDKGNKLVVLRASGQYIKEKK